MLNKTDAKDQLLADRNNEIMQTVEKIGKHLYDKPENRIASYAEAFPPALIAFNGRIYGVWVIGNNYKNKTEFYGQFPPSVLDRILALFPERRRILHLFAGTIQASPPDVITFDINPQYAPTICDDIRNLTKHKKALQGRDLVIADPAYDDSDFAEYSRRLKLDLKPFSKAQVFRDLYDVLDVGAVVTWLDTKKPMYRKDQWHLLGEIMISVSTNHRYRGLCLFQKI
jgi:hypothetical protein